MPIYEYEAKEPEKGCARCRKPFEATQRITDQPLTACPNCGLPLRKLISLPAIGPSGSSYDDRAKKAGFHKLKRVTKGEYEVKY